VLNLSAGTLRGLCIATCCHHRCTWQHYVNRPFFQRLGFSPEEFELISWMTGACVRRQMELWRCDRPCQAV
jgi:Methyltransferase TRM13